METGFYRHRAMASGYLSFCKECVKSRVKAHREKNIDAVQEYDRLRGRMPHRKCAVRDNAHKYKVPARVYRQKNPLKWKAHIALNNAIRSGAVEKPDRCEGCGSTYALHGHHEDYAAPLAVNWLCPHCHGARHREINEARRRGSREDAA